MRRSSLILALGSAATAAACGSDARPDLLGGAVDPGGPGGSFTGVTLQPPPDGYPAGPYGSEVSDTVEDFAFQGWRSPSDSRFDAGAHETIRFSDYFDPDGSRGVNLLMLNTTAGWCANCQIEHEELEERLATHGPNGLALVSVMYHGYEFGETAVEDDLETWARDYDIDFPFAIDPTYRMGRYGAAEAAPLNLLVDPRDMTLIEKFVGNQAAVMWARIEDELEQRAAAP